MNQDIPESIPKNSINISNFITHFISGHPNIKLFFNQGGLQSTEEAIIYNVPMLIMPFFGDQPYNAKRMEYKKVARTIFHQQGLKKETLNSLIMEVIENPM